MLKDLRFQTGPAGVGLKETCLLDKMGAILLEVTAMKLKGMIWSGPVSMR